MPHGFAGAQAPDRLAVHPHIRYDVDFGDALDKAAAGFLHRRPVEIPEAAAEGDEILVAECLAADQQHRMVVPRLQHACEGRIPEVSEIDSPDFGCQAPHRSGSRQCPRLNRGRVSLQRSKSWMPPTCAASEPSCRTADKRIRGVWRLSRNHFVTRF